VKIICANVLSNWKESRGREKEGRKEREKEREKRKL
jgi:hypothetical protein